MTEEHTLNSSFLDSCSYDKEAKELAVSFRNSKIYRYLNVPVEVYEDFKNAPSAGEFYSSKIKGKYELIE